MRSVATSYRNDLNCMSNNTERSSPEGNSLPKRKSTTEKYSPKCTVNEYQDEDIFGTFRHDSPSPKQPLPADTGVEMEVNPAYGSYSY